MSYSPTRLQPLALPCASSSALDRIRLEEIFERIELLVPEVARLPSRGLLAYALAFIAHYQHDHLSLEREWEFLHAALAYAWKQRAYEAVVLLVAALARPASRCCALAEAEHLLRIGIED